MPRVKLVFDPLSTPEWMRKVYMEQVGKPQSKELILKAFRDDSAVVTVPDWHGVVFRTQTLDAQGRLILGSDTEFTYFPTTKPASPLAEPITIENPVLSQGEGPWVEVEIAAVSAEEDEVTTGNADVPVEDAADETPVGDPQPQQKNVEAVVGGVQLRQPEKRMQVEVRVSDNTVTDPSDAQHATTIPVCCGERPRIKAPLCVDAGSTQRVWTQRFDPETCRESEWTFADFVVQKDQSFVEVEDFSNNWAGGTIEDVYGYPTMQDDAGSLAVNDVPSMFADPDNFPDSIFSMEQGPSFFSMEDVFPYGRFETPQLDFGASHDFYPAPCAELDDMQRMTERSIFSESYNMFSEFRGPNGGVPPGRRKAEGAKRDIHMFGSQSDGSPIRVLQEISLNGEDWLIVKPGKRMAGQQVKARYTLFSHRGLRAPKFLNWYWRRWLRNRKWEFEIPWDPTPGSPQTFSIPASVVAVQQLEFNATVVAGAVAGVEYNISVDDSNLTGGLGGVIGGSYEITVEQVVRGTANGAGGAWGATFPKEFDPATTPTLVVAPGDSGDLSYAGYTSVAHNSVSGYLMYPPGTSGPSPLPGSGPVDYVARGVPKTLTNGGDIRLKIQLMGA